MNHESALELVKKWGITQGTIPVGGRWSHLRNVKSDGGLTTAAWWSFPMELGPADPFVDDSTKFVKIEKYVHWMDGESWLLEDFMCDKLHVATRSQISEHNPNAVDLYFPSSGSDAEPSEAVKTWDEYVDVSMNALDALDALDGMIDKKKKVEASTTLLNCSTRMGCVGSSGTHFDTDSLYELFARFEVSHKVPFVVFHDGASPTVKIYKDAIQTLPANVLRRWRRESSGDHKRASLRVYCAVNKHQQYASYILNTDLSAHIVASGLGRLGPQDSESQRKSLAEVGIAIDGSVIKRIESSDVNISLRSARIAMEQRQPLQKMSFRVSLTVGREVHKIPSVAQIQSVVVERLSSVLTLVATASGGKTILSYGRASGASKLQRAQLVVRLMSGRPKAEIEREMISTFAMSPEDAKSFVETSASFDPQSKFQGPVNYRMEYVPIIELRQNGKIGYEAVIINVAKIEYMDRIKRLLQFIVAEAASDKAVKVFPSLPYEMFKGSAKSNDVVAIVQSFDEDADADADADADVDNELDQWLDSEIAGLEDADPNPLDAQDQKEEKMADDSDDEENDGTPQNHILSMLKKADKTLFKYPGSRYATDCARNMMRQPVVLTREELERTNKLFPKGHSGAIVNYGTTPEKAATNAYICPEVWCPRSKIALTRQQFEKLGKKCPTSNKEGDVEEPVVFESKYFSARGTHNPGFLDRRKHPRGFCMPCCFIKKQQHFDRCGANLLVDEESSTNESKRDAVLRQEAKYIRGAEVWPLEPGRYGMLPGIIAEALLGDKFKCGNRDDGSGQLMAMSQCFVRRGAPKSAPSKSAVFLECAAYVLGHSDGSSLIDVLREHLSAGVFLSLDGGRVARRWMDGLDPIEILESEESVLEELKKDETYVKKFGLEGILKGGDTSPELLREVLVFKSMKRYLDYWKSSVEAEDVTEVRLAEPHADGMLDLLSRPHPQINPNHVNLILLESTNGGMLATAPCSSDVNARWRVKDPIGIILGLEKTHYEPIVRTSLVRGGVKEVRTFFPDAFPRLSALVRGYLGTCTTRGRDKISAIIWTLKSEGHPVTTQVIDCFFRLAGLVTSTSLFVPLIGNNMPVLAGDMGAKLKIAYLGDIVTAPTPFARGPISTKEVANIESLYARFSEIARIPGLRPRDRLSLDGGTVVAIRLANGGIVPLVPKALNSPLQYGRERVHTTRYLEHLSSLVRVRRETDRGTEWTDRWGDKKKHAWDLKSRVVKSLRSDSSLSSELVALRSSLHPFSIDAKRKETVRIVLDALKASIDSELKVGKEEIQELADALLFGPKPLSLRREDIKITDANDTAIVFTEAELASGELDVLIQSHERVQIAEAESEISVVSEKDDHMKRTASPVPLDEDSIVRYVGNKHKSGTAHRSSAYRQRRIRVITNVDVYSAIHLAHQMLFSDAPASIEEAVKAVQNALMTGIIAGDIDKMNGTLGKMLEQQKKRHRHQNASVRQFIAGKLASAIAWRGTDYVASTFEIVELSKYLDVRLRLIPPGSSQTLSSAVIKSRKVGDGDPYYIILVEEAYGKGHDLVLSPLDHGAGHRILFRTPIDASFT